MEKLRNILVPLDGSDCAEMVIPQLEILAKALNANISLLRVAHVHMPIPIIFLGANPIDAETTVISEAEEYLKAVEQKLNAMGLHVDSHVRYGLEAEEILDFAEKNQVDMVAMTTHGRGGVKGFFGSVAVKVLRHSSKPVFLVRCP